MGENLSVPVRTLVVMRDRDITNQLPGQVGNRHEDPIDTAKVFADPVGYLADLGITAEIVSNTDTDSPLPVAA